MSTIENNLLKAIYIYFPIFPLKTVRVGKRSHQSDLIDEGDTELGDCLKWRSCILGVILFPLHCCLVNKITIFS